jgi:hypothetical protein
MTHAIIIFWAPWTNRLDTHKLILTNVSFVRTKKLIKYMNIFQLLVSLWTIILSILWNFNLYNDTLISICK